MRDRDSPFLKPLWRRIALVGFCALWAAWEGWSGQTTWAVIVGAMAIYGAWTFLIDYERTPSGDDSAQNRKKP